MASSSPLPLLVLLLAASSSPALFVAAGGGQNNGLTHIRVYMHETFSGPNSTVATPVPSRLGGDVTSFGAINVVDDELRDGPDRAGSALVGRFQGLLAGVGLVTPPGMQSAINLVFTAGDRGGSSLAMLGPILSFGTPIERAVVGGTGLFRMARGYCVMTKLGNPTPESAVYQVDLYLQMYKSRA